MNVKKTRYAGNLIDHRQAAIPCIDICTSQSARLKIRGFMIRVAELLIVSAVDFQLSARPHHSIPDWASIVVIVKYPV